jgi:hypothetical protein
MTWVLQSVISRLKVFRVKAGHIVVPGLAGMWICKSVDASLLLTELDRCTCSCVGLRVEDAA